MDVALIKHLPSGNYVKYHGFLAPISDGNLMYFVNSWRGDFSGDGRSPLWKDFWLHLAKSYIAQKVLAYMKVVLNDPQAYLADMGKGFGQWNQDDTDFMDYMNEIDNVIGDKVDAMMQPYYQDNVVPKLKLMAQGHGSNSYAPHRTSWAMSREWVGLVWRIFDRFRDQIVFHSMPLFSIEQHTVGVSAAMKEVPLEFTVVKPVGKKYKKLLTAKV